MHGGIRALVVMVGVLAGCRNPFGADRAITLRASALAAPTELAAGAELEVTVTVVTGGCNRFERFVVERTAGRLTLTARGRDGSSGGVSCPADVRYETRTYRAAPPFADPLTVAARQPDGTELTREVRIR